MSKITNFAAVKDNEICNVRRSAFELRARWASGFYEEAKAEGLDLEPIMRKAIFKIGVENGEKDRVKFDKELTAHEYGDYFLKRGVPETFEKTLVKDSKDEYIVDFHYCPLVAAWQKSGLDDETIAKMCDIAMDGDRGTAEALGLGFDIESTIAKGAQVCRLCYRTKK